MSSQHAAAVAARFYECFNAGDLDGAVALFDDDYVGHRGLGSGGGGAATVRTHLGMWYAAVPDAQVEVLHTVTDGDWVALFTVLRGTQTGDFIGVPASGQAFEAGGTDMFRVRDGRIVEGWTICDVGSLFIAAGAVPVTA